MAFQFPLFEEFGEVEVRFGGLSVLARIYVGIHASTVFATSDDKVIGPYNWFIIPGIRS